MSALAAPTWTDDRIAELRAYAAEGLTAAQIAHRMRPLTELAIIGRAARLGIELGVKPPPKTRANRRAEIEENDPLFGVAAPPREDAWRPVNDAEPIALIELGANQCPWPICGDDWKAVAHAHCGRPKPDNLPYCAEHTALAYTGGRELDTLDSDARAEKPRFAGDTARARLRDKIKAALDAQKAAA